MKNIIFAFALLSVAACTSFKKAFEARSVSGTPDYGWKMTLNEQFDADTDPSKQNDECYTKVPYCRVEYTTLVPCPQYQQELRYLNKCIWTPIDAGNFWVAKEGLDKFNIYSPKNMKIQNGILTMKAEKVGDKVVSFNMGSLGVGEAYPNEPEAPKGFVQAYGRFETFARFERKPGVWGAVWMVGWQPVKTAKNSEDPAWPGELRGWPYDGEFDVLEYWTGDNGRASMNYHYADWTQEKSHLSKSNHVETNEGQFHLYALEWTPDEIIYEFDNKEVARYKRNEIEMIPKPPMYWFVGHGIDPSKKDKFKDQVLDVDFVRNYAECTENDDPSLCHHFQPLQYSVTAYPNPVANGQTLNIQTETNSICQQVRILIYSSDGRVVGMKNLLSQPNQKTQTYSMPAPQTPGLYVGRLQPVGCSFVRGGDLDKTFKFVVQ